MGLGLSEGRDRVSYGSPMQAALLIRLPQCFALRPPPSARYGTRRCRRSRSCPCNRARCAHAGVRVCMCVRVPACMWQAASPSLRPPRPPTPPRPADLPAPPTQPRVPQAPAPTRVPPAPRTHPTALRTHRPPGQAGERTAALARRQRAAGDRPDRVRPSAGARFLLRLRVGVSYGPRLRIGRCVVGWVDTVESHCLRFGRRKYLFTRSVFAKIIIR